MTHPDEVASPEARATTSADSKSCLPHTSDEPPGDSNSGVRQQFTDAFVTPRPLTENVTGTLTIHFTAGCTIKRSCSQEFAERTIGRWREWDPADPDGDEWVWSDPGTFVVRPDHVGAMGYVRSRRGGWWECPADLKDALITNGYDEGIVEPIINLYTGADEPPLFSLAALYLIQDIAALPGITHHAVCEAIRRLEGADALRVEATRGAFGLHGHRCRTDPLRGNASTGVGREPGEPASPPSTETEQPDQTPDTDTAGGRD